MRMSEVLMMAMLMPARGQRAEHARGVAGRALHARADDADFGQVVGRIDALGADARADLAR